MNAAADTAPIEARTIDTLLRGAAERWPERQLVEFEDGTVWTYLRALEEAGRAANALREQGVERGDRVVILLRNGAPWLRAWWGSILVGAVIAPINPAYKGQALADLCDLVDPVAVVAEADIAGQLEERHRGLLVAPQSLTGPSTSRIDELEPPIRPSDPHGLQMTSGTTGPSKASVTTHAAMLHLDSFLLEGTGMSDADVFLADMPLFHVSGIAPTVQMMRIGAKVAVRDAPALRTYWQTAKDAGATYSLAPGTIPQFLEAQPPSAADTDHAMRFVLCAPLPEDPQRFIERFGLQGLTTAYGSSECNMPIVNMLDTAIRPGSCGRIRHGFDVRLVDDEDHEVPVGQTGELIARCDQPWLQSQGYFGDAAATMRAWRNGWFHTGDALRIDADGYYYFTDRYKDCLRRRGENISSFEVERDVLKYPGVVEAACVGIPDGYGGDDIKIYVVTAPGSIVDADTLLTFLADRMPYFMVPRYIEFIEALPKTASLRVQKHKLRELGNSENTWDREASGLHICRDGLVRMPTPSSNMTGQSSDH